MLSGRRKGILTTLLLVAGVAAAAPHEVAAQEGFVGWVGLYSHDRLGWLENENRIAELCPPSADLETCRATMLAPITDTLPLHSGPRDSSSPVGALLVVLSPVTGMSALFVDAKSGVERPFVPDVFLQDWGYGPFFHQTFVQRVDDWFQLPAGPWDTPVWVHLGGDGPAPSLMSVHPEDIVELRGRGMFVVQASPSGLVLRSEQPADLWCHEEDPPPLVEDRPVFYPRSELLDEQGHLLIRPKYLKGC